MGNENKINGEDNALQKGKSEFLPEVIKDIDEKPVAYSLSEEFAKTKRNRNPFIFLAIIAFVGALVTGTILLTAYINKKFRDSKISISAFEDLRLIEILDKSKKLEGNLTRAREKLAELRAARDDAVRRADSPEAKKAAARRYRARIIQRQREVYRLQKEISSYDARLQDSIKKAEEMVSNYQKLHRLKMEEQRNNLILKYNPWFTGKYRPPLRVPRYREEANATSDSDNRVTRRAINNYNLLMSRMQRIPYRNSVKPALDKMDNISRVMENRYNSLWNSVSRYRHAFNYLARTKPESGFVVDPSDTKNIYVHLKSEYSVKDGTTGLVFRNDDEYVGKIQFFWAKDGIRAKALEIKPGKEMLPFDKILIKVQ